MKIVRATRTTTIGALRDRSCFSESDSSERVGTILPRLVGMGEIPWVSPINRIVLDIDGILVEIPRDSNVTPRRALK